MLDLIIVLGFVAYALWSGFSARKDASLGPEEYFLAGRSMSGWKAGLSMTATQFAADTPLVVTGLIATAGVFALWRFWVYSLAFLLMGFLLAPAWRRAGILTDAELCETRYSGGAGEILRYLKAFYFGTIINCVVLAMVLLAATRITEPFLPWHEWIGADALSPLVALVEWVGKPITVNVDSPDVWLLSADNLFSILAIVFFTTLYSATGGLRSVINTDVVQLVLAFVATFTYAWIISDEAGGLSAFPEKLTELYGAVRMEEMLSFSPAEGAASVLAVFGLLGIQWFAQANSDGTGYLAQRSMACRSDDEARKAAVVFTYAQSVVRSLFWLPIIVGLMIVYPMTGPLNVAEREATFVQGVADLLPTGILGLMLVGLFAALASTVDTHLNWGAGYWTNDLYDRLWCQRIRKTRPDKKKLVWIARAANVFILVVALAIMSQLDNIQTAWMTSLLLGAGMGVPLLLRWVWYRQNAWGELAPIAMSFVAAPALLYWLPGTDPETDALRLILMTVLATGASVIASLVTKPVDPERLKAFYREVHPPGFWGPVAHACDMPVSTGRRAFWRGLGATFTAAASVFALIIGIGTWVLHAPGPDWAPRWLWIGGMILVGFGLIPVWVRLGRQASDAQNALTEAA